MNKKNIFFTVGILLSNLTSCHTTEVSYEKLFPVTEKITKDNVLFSDEYLLKEKTVSSDRARFTVKKSFALDSIILKQGDEFSWMLTERYIDWIKLANTREFSGVTWLGNDGVDNDLHNVRITLYLFEKQTKPRFGILGKDLEIDGILYQKHRYICLNSAGKVERYYPFNVSDLSWTSFNLHDDKCTIAHLSLKSEYEVEGVTWLKGTSLEFDESFKWHFIRMRPGQEFQGKVYKDGGVLLRGEYNKYQKNHGPEDIRILTPDMENYPH